MGTSDKPRKKKKTPAPTASFADSVAQAQLNKLKPFIAEQAAQSVNLHGQFMLRKLSQMVAEDLSRIQTRQMALERILKKHNLLEDETLFLEVSAVEDGILGYDQVTGPSQQGDQLRITVETKEDGAEQYGNQEKLRIVSLMREQNGEVQSFKPLEEALVGTHVGDSVEVFIKPEKEDEKGAWVQATINVISRKKEVENG